MGETGAVAHNHVGGRPRSSGRRTLVWALVVALGVTGVSTAAAAQSETPAEQAAREIQEARDRANAAADAFFEAESDIDQLEDELEDLESDEASLQATVDELRGEVEVVALARYIDSGTQGIPLLTDVSAPQDQVQAEVYLDILTNTGADVIDEYEFAQKELADTQDRLDDRRADLESERETFRQLEQNALDEVERLREIEAERLENEAVQRALEAKIAEELAEEQREARLAAEAAARAQPNPGLVVPEPAGADQQASAPAPSGSNDSNDGDAASVPGTTSTTTTTTTIATNTGGSGGTSGGRTGEGGGGNTPAPAPSGGPYVDNITCPMPGSAFGDTWGAARSGGRRHEGVDMIAPRGLPIYAVTSGTATFKQNRLGGNAVSLVGDNGNRYYYAHLDRYEGSSRRVTAGELIGYNGDTGNARFSTPHLHFQVHPGGGQAVNPYPTVRAAGC